MVAKRLELSEFPVDILAGFLLVVNKRAVYVGLCIKLCNWYKNCAECSVILINYNWYIIKEQNG